MLHGHYNLLVILYISVLFPDSEPKSALRIIGGRDALPGEYAFAVRGELHYKYTVLYGIDAGKTTTKIIGGASGAALTPRWTLTAGHCAAFNEGKSYTRNRSDSIEESMKYMIRYGNPHLKPSENTKLAAILKTKIPETYLHPARITFEDIGLLYTEPILIDTYAKISAIDYTSLYGHEVTCIGFGQMRTKPGVSEFDFTFNLDKPLQVLEKAMLRSCDGPRNEKQNMKICVVPKCGEDQTVYYGDSGGPVLHTSGVIGVNSAIIPSFFEEASERRKPYMKHNILIVTPVSLYLDWIYSHIRNDDEDKI